MKREWLQKISVMSYQMRFWNSLESHQIRQQESRIVRSLPDRDSTSRVFRGRLSQRTVVLVVFTKTEMR